MQIAKQAITNVVSAIGEVNFGLMRYHQIEQYLAQSGSTISTYNRNDLTDFVVYDEGRGSANRCAVTSCNEELVSNLTAPASCNACSPSPACDDLRINYIGAGDTISCQGVIKTTPNSCTSNANCVAGDLCRNGQCVTPGNQDCPAGMTCTAFGQSCANSLNCVAGTCLPIANNLNCANNNTCTTAFGPNSSCIAGKCSVNRCVVGGCTGTPTDINLNTNCSTAGSPFSGADVLVQVSPDGANQILPWIDGRETCQAFFNKALNNSANSRELRATGNTPLAGSLRAARANYLTRIAADLAGSPAPCAGRPAFCKRDYFVILLTDGLETCETADANGDGVPDATVAAAAALRNTNGHDVKTFVIGLGLFGASQGPVNAIAAAGGTGQAFFPTDLVGLQLALQTIIRGTIRSEVCNGIDDNCNGQIDEGVTNACGTCGPVMNDFCASSNNTVCPNGTTGATRSALRRQLRGDIDPSI